MRILHTADLHLGRQLHGFSMADDHAVILDQILAALETHQPDLFVIAGDLFDRPAPPATAMRQFNRFLTRARAVCDAGVVMIAGNHDNGDRIEAMAVLADPDQDLIRGALRADEPPMILQDDAGPVAISALPFAYEYAARDCFDDDTIATPEDVIRAQIAATRAQVPEGARWVVVAHAFVAGGDSSDSEKSLTRVGGIEYVSAQAFEGAHYVALGHLHKPQSAGAEHIRYSGAPLGFGFDESGDEKSMSLVDLAGDGTVQITTLPFAPTRQLRVLRGPLEELLASPPSQDFVKVVLTDDTPQIDPMKRLRTPFPNTCLLTYERDERAPEFKADSTATRALLDDPVSLVSDFLSRTRDAPTRDSEIPLIATALADLARKEHDA